MNLLLRATLVAATVAFALPAVAQDAKQDAPKPAAPKDYTILKVAGEDLKFSDVADIWKGLFPTGNAPDFSALEQDKRENVLRGLATERLIYSEAVKSGFDKNEDVKKRAANVERQIIMQAYMENKAKSLATEADLKAAYSEKQAALKNQEEVKARHILVATEEEAKNIAVELKKGGAFDKIAKEKSTDKASGANGGDLGWFTKERMVPEFADAAFKLKKGETSVPVKSPFGWHIIALDDRRPVKLPSLEEMKPMLEEEISNKKLQAFVEDLLKKADIKYYGEDGKEKPFPRTLEAAPAAGGAKP